MDHILDITIRVLVAFAFGALVGLERELRDHPAGIRTHILVSVGACVFTLMSLYAFPAYIGGDRVAAAVVTGIGFIGAGAILRGNGGGVSGMTTAASLWSCAGLGMMAGAGFYVSGLIVVAIVLLALEALYWLSKRVFSGLRNRRMILEIKADYRQNWLDDTLTVLVGCHGTYEVLSYQRLDRGEELYAKIKAMVPAKADVQELTDQFYKVPGTREVIWE